MENSQAWYACPIVSFAPVMRLFTDIDNSPRLPRSQLLVTDEISWYPMLITMFIIFTLIVIIFCWKMFGISVVESASSPFNSVF